MHKKHIIFNIINAKNEGISITWIFCTFTDFTDFYWNVFCSLVLCVIALQHEVSFNEIQALLWNYSFSAAVFIPSWKTRYINAINKIKQVTLSYYVKKRGKCLNTQSYLVYKILWFILVDRKKWVKEGFLKYN